MPRPEEPAARTSGGVDETASGASAPEASAREGADEPVANAVTRSTSDTGDAGELGDADDAGEVGDTDRDDLPTQLASTRPAAGVEDGSLPLLGHTVAPDSPEPRSLHELRELEDLPIVPRERYVIEEPFARGGIGAISRARDVQLDRIVALKELRRQNSNYARLRFAREIRLTARLSHPHIVPLYEAGRWPSGEPFFAMKLVEGSSLDEAIDRCDGRHERMELLGHVANVADAIAYAHSQHVVHRDLKPANVLVGPFGETVVIDWGLARDTRDRRDDLPEPDVQSLRERYQTTDGAIMGTPPYMPPEQAAGQPVDERADVYALGAILYHLLGGRVPYFEVAPPKILERVIARPPAPLIALEPDLPPDLLAIVAKAMARDPDDRYRSAREMADELRRFRSGRLVGAYTYSALELAQRFVTRHQAAVVVTLAALAVLVGFAAWSFHNIAAERDRAEDARAKEQASALAEAAARAQAEERLAETILSSAEAALVHDPTLALTLLEELPAPRAGAPTVAADAVERGAARVVLGGLLDRVEVVAVGPDDEVFAAGIDGAIVAWDGTRSHRLVHHDERVSGLAFTGGDLVSSGYDGRLVRWDARVPRAVAERDAPMRALAATGDWIATVSDDGVRLWRAEGLEERWRVPAPTDRAVFAHFSSDGRLATGSHDHALWLLDLAGGVTRIPHPGEVKAMAFSPDGERFATGCDDGRIRIFSDGTAPDRVIEAHRGAVEAVAFVDERLLASGGFDGAVILWDLETGIGRRLVDHGERVVTVTVSPEGDAVASSSWDKTVAVSAIARGTVRRLRGHRDVVSALAFTAGGELVSGSWDREVRIWPAASRARRRIEAHRVGVKTVAFSPDGALLASGGHDDAVRLWRASDGAPLATWEGHTDHVFRVLFAPTGRVVASSSDDTTVRLWSVDDGPLGVLEGHTADVEELAFSADGALLASAGEDAAVGLWNVRTRSGTLLRGHRGAVTDVAFGSDHLASSGRDGTVRLWRLPDGKAERHWEIGTEVTTLAFSPDRRILAAAGDSVWLREGEDVTRLDVEGLSSPQSLAFSPDGSTIAVGSARGPIWLCAIADRRCRELAGHEARIHALVFGPDGKTLLSASGDGTVRVWDVASGESAPMRAHTASVFDLALAPDGTRAASGSGDMTIVLFPPPPPPDQASLPALIDRVTRAEP